MLSKQSLNKFLRYFWPIQFSTKKEEWDSDDMTRRESFVTSSLCPSIEKSLRNRMAERNDEVLFNIHSEKAKLAHAKMEELQDILLEWSNIRSDFQKKNAL